MGQFITAPLVSTSAHDKPWRGKSYVLGPLGKFDAKTW
jgi:hypothetical protein